MKILAVLTFTCMTCALFAQQPEKIPVLTLGTFHFNFPNLDVQKVEKKDQIDVLEAKYQEEIEDLVARLSRFKPTIVVIERRPGQQGKIDSLYAEFLRGRYTLERGEEEQIGFRLAKAAGIKKLYCVDEWGNFNETIAGIMEGKDSIRTERFEWFYFHNPDSAKKIRGGPTLRENGIRRQLLLMNNAERIKQSLGSYLVGMFKYEEEKNDFLGVDFETGRWFSRNLKIFRNIQRIKTTPGDRIVVIFGSDHMNLLNYLFDCSPEYELDDVTSYLK